MKKEAVLICLYAYYPFENSNTNVMISLIKELSNIYEVHILTENRNNSALEYEIENSGIIIHRYPRINKIKKQLQNLIRLDKKKKRNIGKKFFINIFYPVAKLLDKYSYFEHPEYTEIQKLMKKINFTFVMTTCANFDSHRNMLRYKKNSNFLVPWISYFMDPFAYYIENRNVKGDLLKMEIEVYEKSDLVFVTEEIYQENHKNELKKYLYKTVPVKFGNFQISNFSLLKDIFIPDKINCVYVGSLLNERIRDPHLFYKIINLSDDRFVFHIVCNNISEANKKTFKEVVKNKKKVFWYHNLPLIECLGIINSADILINLGNNTTNQTPSKVFDYIGTGRPIVNLCSIEQDTSRKYLKDYPMVLNIVDLKLSDDEILKKFTDFSVYYQGKVVLKEEIRKIYKIYEASKVNKKILQEIQSLIKG